MDSSRKLPIPQILPRLLELRAIQGILNMLSIGLRGNAVLCLDLEDRREKNTKKMAFGFNACCVGFCSF